MGACARGCGSPARAETDVHRQRDERWKRTLGSQARPLSGRPSQDVSPPVRRPVGAPRDVPRRDTGVHNTGRSKHTGATPSGRSRGAEAAHDRAPRVRGWSAPAHALAIGTIEAAMQARTCSWCNEQRTALDAAGGRTIGAVAQRDEAVAIPGLHARGPSARGAERQRAGSLQSGRSCKTLPSLSAWPQAPEGRRM